MAEASAVQNPVLRIFTLEDFGIKTDAFVRFMRPWFSAFHLDPYDAKRNKVNFLKDRFPGEEVRLNGFLADYYADRKDLSEIIDILELMTEKERHEFDRIGMTGRRKRAIAKFTLVRTTQNFWDIKRVPAEAFQQRVSTDDPRSLVRRFHEAPDDVAQHAFFLSLMNGVANMVAEVRPHATRLEMTAHWMFIFADSMLEGDNSPEGIHQDGADYIVSALVMERAGILGGESVVYTGDKERELLRHTLQVGEALFQDDRNLWHYVTPIKEDANVDPQYGNRSIIGFDMNVIEE